MTEIPRHVFDLVAEGRTIEAIKEVRDATSLGLKEAKGIVDRIADGEIVSDGATHGDALSEEELARRIRADLDSASSIHAIKTARDLTGLDLKDAKALVDRVEREDLGASAPQPEDEPDELAREVLALVEDGRKIEAIKRVREATGSGLREAKAVVDRISGVEPTAASPLPLAVLVALAAVALTLFVVYVLLG